jgi:putative oxidoreductase
VAATFLGFHGRHKAQELLGGDLGFVQTVAALGLPAPAMFAALAVATQLGAGVCLLLGVATRPAALALAVTMVFAIAEKWPSGFLAIEPALTYLTICVVLTVTGAGRDPSTRDLSRSCEPGSAAACTASRTRGSAPACRPFCSPVACSRARTRSGCGRRACSPT